MKDSIELPIRAYNASDSNDIEDNKYVYDFETMADELEIIIHEKLGKNVLITISELDEEELRNH